MAKNPRTMLNEFTQGFESLEKTDPQRLQAFNRFGQLCEESGALDTKTKALISVAIAVYVHCEYCIVYHTNEALKLGATREELTEVAHVAWLMGGGPAVAYSVTLLKDTIETFAPDYEGK